MTEQALEQRFTDQTMHERIVTLVEKALADAVSPRPFEDTVGPYKRTYAPFEGDKTYLIAARLVGNGGTVWSLEGKLLDEDETGPSLSAVDLPVTNGEQGRVTWRRGNCTIPMAQYLDWWEGIVDESKQAAYEAAYAGAIR